VNGDTMLRVAIIGCGQIADAHLKEIKKIAGAQVVAVCDATRDLAERAAQVFAVPGCYADVAEMLGKEKIDVVHITTPPGSHKDLAIQCLRAGVHVYVEKPFTVNATDAQAVLAVAAEKRRRVCVGHNELFDPVWLETRELIKQGALGDIVHIESLQGYDVSGPFGALVRSDPGHWVRRLPGGVFFNTISHPVYKITDCLPNWEPDVQARWGQRKGVNFPLPFELRVNLWGEDATASLWVSSTSKPVQRIARIYGTRASVEVDLQAQALIPMASTSMRGPFVPLEHAWRRRVAASRTFRKFVGHFLRNRIHFFAGLNGLISAFYESIRTDTESPTPPVEIVRVTAIMDRIFAVCAAQDAAR
jgi:predicted dehydrogenase